MISPSEIVIDCQLQFMMRSYGPDALFNLIKNHDGIKTLSESLSCSGFQPQDEVMGMLRDHINFAV